MWNNKRYLGPLSDYTYPRDIECGDLLQFLKQVNTNKRVHLTDVIYRGDGLPKGYDTYILCGFGEYVDDEFIARLDKDDNYPQVILITSQLYASTNYKKVRVFHLEHLHTIKRFFTKEPYLKLSSRLTTHGSLSGRSALHKSIMTVKLLSKFDATTDYNYTFCNRPTVEYQINNLVDTLSMFYPGVDLTLTEIKTIEYLHSNPKILPGDQWDVDNDVYRDCKLNWDLESIFLSRQYAPLGYLTEKTIKPIISGSGFIIAGQQLSYTRLQNLGFESIIEFPADDKNDYDRFNALFDLIENYDFDELMNSAHTQDIVDYNYNYFWGAFYSHIEYRNRERIEQILDYINET